MNGKLTYYLWSLIQRFGTSFISLGGNILLSYLISPEDFGLIGMLGVFTSLIFVFIDCGLSDCLLRYEKPSDRDFNTVFVFNTSVGALVCLIYNIIAPYVATMFGHEQLETVMRVFGFGAIFSAMSISQQTKLFSNLQFKRIAIFNLTTITTSLALAVVIAELGYSYWALVMLQAGYALIYFILLLLFSNWRIRLEFDYARFKEFWSFGVNLLLSTVAIQVSRNIYTAILGKYFSAIQTGYMGQAQKLSETPTTALESSISFTSFTLISKESDPEQKKNSILRMFGIMTFVNSMVCFFLLSLSAPLIDFVFPDKWLPAIPYFRIMLCLGLIAPINNFMFIIFKIYNRTSTIRNIVFFEKIGIIVLALLLYRFGIYAMIGSSIGLAMLCFAIYAYCAKQVAGFKCTSFFKILSGNILIFTIIGAITYLTTRVVGNSFMALLIGTTAFFACVIVTCKLIRKEYYNYLIDRLKIKH